MKYPRKVYAIQHNETKRMYIGSSCEIDKRYSRHINFLRSGKHKNEDMQKDFNEYGENFSVYILDEISEYKENYKEYEWMYKYNTIERGIGYNYADKVRVMQRIKNKPPYKEGLPDMEVKGVTRTKVHKLVDELNESELIYVHTIITRQLGGRK